MLVSNYMTAAPVTIALDADYGSAFDVMQDRNMHHLPVVDATGHIVGIVTRRDLQLAASHFQEAPVEVSDVMHTPVSTVKPETTISEAAAMMVDQHIGGLPVIDGNNEIVGMVTETDLFRALTDCLQG